MATQTMTWTKGGTFQDADAIETFTETCASGCGQPVTEQTPYRYCPENGEVCHKDCPLPIWE
jgi:hypothetical protein